MNNIKRIFSYSKNCKRYYIFSLIFGLIASLLAILTPLLVGYAINTMTADNMDFKLLLFYCFLLVVCYLVSELLNYLISLMLGTASQSIIKEMRLELFNKIHASPISYIDTTPFGEYISRMNVDIDNIGFGLIQGTIQILRGVGTIAGTMIIMFVLNPQIALAVVCLTPLSFLVSFIIAKGSQKHFVKNARNISVVNNYANEYIGNQKTVIANSFEEQSMKTFEKANENARVSYFHSHFFSAITNPSARLVNNSVYIIVGALGIYLRLSVGDIGSFIMYSSQFTNPFNEITSVTAEFQKALASAKRVFDVFDKPSLIDVDTDVTINENSGNVDFDNVFFSYDKDKELIKNFDLSVKTGEQIAIIGTTGAGKTTIINLLMRYYDVDKGDIKIDGLSINSLPYEMLRGHISIVLQDSFIKEASVFENIAFGQNATLEEVVEASRNANCYDIIKRLPNGFDTIITPSSLSKGEMQLICIARAMVENAPILILDEATSNIDSLTEIKVQNAFLKLMENKTSFVIAHRLTTIQNADKIVVMDKGNIVEIGNHNELMELDGLYARLYRLNYNN